MGVRACLSPPDNPNSHRNSPQFCIRSLRAEYWHHPPSSSLFLACCLAIPLIWLVLGLVQIVNVSIFRQTILYNQPWNSSLTGTIIRSIIIVKVPNIGTLLISGNTTRRWPVCFAYNFIPLSACRGHHKSMDGLQAGWRHSFSVYHKRGVLPMPLALGVGAGRARFRLPRIVFEPKAKFTFQYQSITLSHVSNRWEDWKHNEMQYCIVSSTVSATPITERYG